MDRRLSATSLGRLPAPRPSQGWATQASPTRVVGRQQNNAQENEQFAEAMIAAMTRDASRGAFREDPLAEQAHLLTKALDALRARNKPGLALDLLNQLSARHPQSAFSSEIQVARIEALLALDRNAEALSLLDEINLASLPRADELRVLRGELRSAEHRCEAALDDFGALRSAKLSSVRERALYGEAVCNVSLGRRVAAHRDLEQYQLQYPRGRFVVEVEGELEKGFE